MSDRHTPLTKQPDGEVASLKAELEATRLALSYMLEEYPQSMSLDDLVGCYRVKATSEAGLAKFIFCKKTANRITHFVVANPQSLRRDLDN